MADKKIPPPPPGQVGVIKPQSTSSKLWIWILLALALFVFGGSGVYFLALQEDNDPATAQMITLNSEKTITPTVPAALIDTGERLPDAFPTLLPTDTLWKQYRTSVYRMNYLPSWRFNYYVVQSGVQIFNPDSMIADSSTTSGKLIPSQYVSISTITSSESALMYTDRVQVACCIGPSAAPGNAAKFKKMSLVINGESAIAYTPLDVTPERAWDIVLATGKHLVLIYSTITDPKGTTIENQMINSLTLLE